ncbi:MAG: hypothetical protein AMXMBFR33_29770 [Candidatus Xenobia bacterium]
MRRTVAPLRGRRLLFLSPYADRPLYGGAVVRIHHLVRELCRRNQVWWVTRGPLQGPPPEGLAGHLAASPTRWRQLFDPLLVLRLARAIRRHRIELILASTWIAGLHGVLLKHLSGRPLVLDEHNVEFRLTPWLRGWEGFLCRQADEVWGVSADDLADLSASFGLKRLRLVPNGAEPGSQGDRSRARQRLGLPRERPVALFFGVLRYAANREAVELVLSELAPRLPDFEFLVAGVGCEQFQERANVRLLGFVDDLSVLLAACDVVIVPLRTGSGTRLKVLEALAAGRPVVSTSLGVAGLEVSGVRVEDDWDAFAEAVRTAPGASPPELPERYRWERIVEAL